MELPIGISRAFRAHHPEIGKFAGFHLPPESSDVLTTFRKFAEGGQHIAGLRREVESGKFADFRMVGAKGPGDANWQLQGARHDLLPR